MIRLTGFGISPRATRSARVDSLRAAVAGPWTPVVVVTALYVEASYAIGPLVGWRGPAVHELVLVGSVIVGLVVVLAAGAMGMPLAPLAGRFALLLVLMNVTVAVFTGWRVSLPSIQPFAWDPTLDRLDIALHGERPWKFVHAVVGVIPGLPQALNEVYAKGWFIANGCVVLMLALSPLGARGQRVLLAYVLQYAILGSLLAVVFSSAGPVYYARVVGESNPYAGIGASLAVQIGPAPVFGARSFQEWLWARYLAGNTGLTTGISAFPSIHVSSSVLLALAAGSWRRWAGVLGWLFAALTFVGSIYFGWHYAVDGYAATIGMLALWWVAGRMPHSMASEPVRDDRAQATDQIVLAIAAVLVLLLLEYALTGGTL